MNEFNNNKECLSIRASIFQFLTLSVDILCYTFFNFYSSFFRIKFKYILMSFELDTLRKAEIKLATKIFIFFTHLCTQIYVHMYICMYIKALWLV